MPSDVEQIETIRTMTLAQLADMHTDPSAGYQFGSEDVTWAELVSRLEQTVDWCDEKLAGYRPFEIRSEGTT